MNRRWSTTGTNYVYGELLQSGVCLRVAYVDQTFPERTPDGLLVIWPAGFDFRVSDDIVRVVDQDGHVVASVGERMRISGRWLSEEAGKSPEWDWSGGSAGDCVGPYWLVGDEVTEVRNERTEGGVASEIFLSEAAAPARADWDPGCVTGRQVGVAGKLPSGRNDMGA